MSDTVIGSLIGGVVGVTGSVLIWLGSRGKTRADGALSRDQLDAQTRQNDITTIFDGLKEQVEYLRNDVKNLRRENVECYADREKMREELGHLRARVAHLEGKETQ